MSITPEESKKRMDALKEASEPLIKFLNEQGHPHMKVIVDCDSAELVEGVCSIKNDKHIKD